MADASPQHKPRCKPHTEIWRQRMACRARMFQATRSYFDAQGFLEVDTPVAIGAPAPELHSEAPEVWIQTAHGPVRRFLQTSPELAMKRLLAHGLTCIYQIAVVFRDGDDSLQHRPEFRMLEWYRAHSSWTRLLEDCEGLLRACAQAVLGDLVWTYQGQTVDVRPPFQRISVEEAFCTYAGFSILEALEPPLLRQRLIEHRIFHAPDDSWEDLFHRVLIARVEPALKNHPQPYFLTDFPAPVACLAQLSPRDPRVAERFELYAAGLELANGFGELTEEPLQRQRFLRERARRCQAGRRDYPLDEHFLASLRMLPPSAGIALGMERLGMLLLNLEDLDGISFLPWLEA